MLFLFNRAGRESHWFDRKMSKNHEFGLSCALDAYVCVPSPKCCVTGRHASVLKHVTFLLCLSSMGFSSSSWFLLEWLVVVVVVVVRHSLLPFHRFAQALSTGRQTIKEYQSKEKERREKGRQIKARFEGKNDRVGFKLIYFLIQLNISYFSSMTYLIIIFKYDNYFIILGNNYI
jgi:hypothetical protein